jgi:hypothetical protein
VFNPFKIDLLSDRLLKAVAAPNLTDQDSARDRFFAAVP